MDATVKAMREASGDVSILRAGAPGARPLVLLHGIGSNARSFEAVMSELAGSRPVIAWDAPGYGTSAPLEPAWPLTDDYVAALRGLLDRLGVGRVDLLGHSMGALIAARFAVLHPGRLGRLILASPALGYGTAPEEALAPPAAARLDGMIAEGAERFAATRGPRLVFARDRAELVAGVVKGMSEVKLPGYAQASRMLSCADLVADAARIKTPTLVVVGANDEITPPANCLRLYNAIAAATPTLPHRFATVPACGHAMAQEQPRALTAEIAAFAPTVTAEG